jgi:hypothetical protein
MEQDELFGRILRRSESVSDTRQPLPEHEVPEPEQETGIGRDDWERPKEEHYLR